MNPIRAQAPPEIPSAPPLGEVFRVGPWRVDTLALSIDRDDGPGSGQRLEPRVMALLVRLAAAGGRPVPRDALIDSVWHGAIVSDDAVNSAVARLRRALDGESGNDGGASAIETIPRIGYRMRLPVEGDPAAALRPLADTDRAETPPGPPAGSPEPCEPTPSTAPGHPPTPRPEAGGAIRPRIAAVVSLSLAAVLLIALLLWVAGRREAGGGAASGAPGMRPLSTGVRPLTALPHLEALPALAPGELGDRVAFSWQGSAGDNWDLYVQAIEGGPLLRLTTDPGADLHATWAPDASYLAFVRRKGGECGIWTVPALGGD